MSDELTRLPERLQGTRSRARVTLQPAVLVVMAPFEVDALQPSAARVVAADGGKLDAQTRAPADPRLLLPSAEAIAAAQPSGEALRAVAAYRRQAKSQAAAPQPSLRCIA